MVAGLSAVALARSGGVVGKGAVDDAARVAAAAILLFGVCGFGVTRLWLPAPLRRHELLWVLPIGACAAALELTVLAYLWVPFTVALVAVMAVNAALGIVAWRRGEPSEAGGNGQQSLVVALAALYIAVLIGAVALIPMFRSGFATVIGNGSDAHLAVGTAQFLSEHYPTALAISEPVDQVPLVWRSKPPIYEAYAGVAAVAGLAPYAVISTLAAMLIALAALGFWLVARDLLGAGPWGAGAAMALVGLDRMVLHTGMHPYFNQTWGFFALPFALVLAHVAVRRRTRSAVVLLAVFLAVLAFAYPLALPIALLALLVFAGFERRRRRLPLVPRPRLSRRSLVWLVPLAAILIVPALGIFEKVGTASAVLTHPSQGLGNWGGDLTGYFPEWQFLSVSSGGALIVLAPVLALGLILALRAAPREVRWGIAGVLAFGALATVYFRARDGGWYFHFKALAFIAPLAVATAAVGLARLRWLGAILLVVVLSVARIGAGDEVGETFDQLPRELLALRSIDSALPAGASVRLDMNADGRQLWAAYMLSGQRLCSQRPVLDTSYPHVPVSRAADYVLVERGMLKPFDALGAPVIAQRQFRLYRLRPGLPGGDRCSQRAVQTVDRVL